MEGTDIRENRAFIYLDRKLKENGVNVPEVLAVSSDEKYYLQDDLGGTSLFSLAGTDLFDLYLEKAVKTLPSLQCSGDIDWNYPALQHPFSSRSIMADLNYFKYCFLKPCKTDFDEEKLEDDFERLSKDILEASKCLEGMMYRDCQSRNIMIQNEDVWWIDFQGARRGPMIYDIVSLLWQAKLGLSEAKRQRLLDLYFSSLNSLREFPTNLKTIHVNLFALFRTLQVLGAYGFRGLVEHRAHFITSIPGALNNLSELITKGVTESYPELNRILKKLCDLREDFSPGGGKDKLNIEIFSFSYKKGYPDDFSGNGGGFMFDCRALHNPGRYDRYKPLTGMDSEVIEFLENNSEVKPFLESVFTLVDASIKKYLKRGFTNLQVGFGCTGGRHRSVYCAEHLAEHIRATFGEQVVINLIHREQGVKKEM